jgi:hypothetical protein
VSGALALIGGAVAAIQMHHCISRFNPLWGHVGTSARVLTDRRARHWDMSSYGALLLSHAYDYVSPGAFTADTRGCCSRQ